MYQSRVLVHIISCNDSFFFLAFKKREFLLYLFFNFCIFYKLKNTFQHSYKKSTSYQCIILYFGSMQKAGHAFFRRSQHNSRVATSISFGITPSIPPPLQTQTHNFFLVEHKYELENFISFAYHSTKLNRADTPPPQKKTCVYVQHARIQNFSPGGWVVPTVI